MIAHPPTIRRTLLLSAAVLLATAASLSRGMPVAARWLLPALTALVSGLLLWRHAGRAETKLGQRLAEAEARLAAGSKAGAQLRHDLRGILSPALLTADRLSNSQDPLARRAAETMIATIERAEIRLRDEQATPPR